MLMEPGQTFEQIIVNGGSMRPFFGHGQRLIVKKTDGSDLRVGDPVVFKHPRHGRVLLHRIRGKKKVDGKTLLLIRGDNNGHYDGWVDLHAIKGVAVKRFAGHKERYIWPLENRLALLTAPLIFRLRRLVISVLAFCMRFLYSCIRLKKVNSLDFAGVRCIEFFWHGWSICRCRSNGRTWVHPVFAGTGVLEEIMQEF